MSTAVENRSYSRNSATTSAEPDTGTPRSRRSRSASACSTTGSAYEYIKHTATASAPWSRATAATEAATASISSARPAAGTCTPSRIPGSASGGGRSENGSYSDGRSWRAISISDSNPASVTSRVLAPRRSSRALVATVVPWSRSARESAGTAAPAPAITPSLWSWGVDGTLPTVMAVPSHMATSVNVPPTSIPTVTRAGARPSPAPGHGAVARPSLRPVMGLAHARRRARSWGWRAPVAAPGHGAGARPSMETVSMRAA